MDETHTPLFTNPNVSLFLDDIVAYDSSSSLSQSTVPPDESPLVVELADSSYIVPSSSLVSLPPPLCHTSHISQPFILL